VIHCNFDSLDDYEPKCVAQFLPLHIDIQQAFPDIGATVGGASKEVQIAGIQLTNSGWRVAGR
jgi:hypothetical protein